MGPLSATLRMDGRTRAATGSRADIWAAWRPRIRRVGGRAAGAGLVLGVIVALTLLGDVILPVDGAVQHLGHRLHPPLSTTPDRVFHALGTDHLGRDVLARTIVGARVSLLVAVIGVLGAGLAGIVAGLVSGFAGGRVDDTLMALADVQLALPFTLVALSLGALTGPSLFNVLVVLFVTGWVAYARLVRAHVLSLRETEFILAARSLGCGAARVLVHHVLRNCVSSIVVASTAAMAQLMVAEATISFLGVGVPSWVPSWGSMISEGRSYLPVAWWVVLIPGAALTATVIAINVLGDCLSDGLNPRAPSAHGGRAAQANVRPRLARETRG